MAAVDLELRRAALQRVRELQMRYDDLIPRKALDEGYRCRGEQISFGSFFSGIYRPRQCRDAGAVCLVTAPPKQGRAAPYEDEFDERRNHFTYRFRDAQTDTERARLDAARDNRLLFEAARLAAPLVYFRGIAPGQYAAVQPVFITSVDEQARTVGFEAGLPVADLTPEGPTSAPETRRYATREAVFRLHQHRFRAAVLRAYGGRCTVCALREAPLLQAAHIIEDRADGGAPTVVNGLALCAIHHLAYDRNLMGIDPDGVVHIAGRLLREVDGPMLRSGLQHFHGERIRHPRRRDERPDPSRLDVRFAAFRRAAA